ncbi:LON peptidase substrate-binding domain-containing protein [Gemmatimonas sp.]|jgi:Lon protease-like protein|uniref:LON peptidase substrate-binding domain-containing protein n=1 Tax=Gemmatimonas sp. TaxID=1962908 RepID=UPI0022C01FDB|nr:LON peptidase substrate-binding domain-containing protein [Gemmatimonas sp.]MCA2984558.1 LON peptidase substrate-binding domain-containing protein [Gemmatimonas sp.]MCA2985929.1 LON peptidase substrate-binding domain-containing protein [Gemmatimonas sp.]MCA2989723.1 LON peptidase substrate-binding domain-containing protein [Gemmatimonas sp.]MCE2954317.1 LON peptidase substrate-binding domain-containing protein [Gemmatimonas sp.]MCZ8011477.1 LON peptidase substrate-binding domain-containing 
MPLPPLPIFPLGVVLYPGTALPLHLFEPRYRQLLTDVRAGDSRFGILTAMSGVAERDLPPGRLGCVAEVTEVEMMPDGRSNIVVVGRERFALGQFLESDTPYHVAAVTAVPDQGSLNAVALAVASDDVVQHFTQVVKAVHAINGQTGPVPPLPDDPAQLAWTIAAMIDLDLDARYKLLAERDPAARLTAIDAVLRKAIPELELQAALRKQS